jgi:diguanylate cyclase (GGDEF)-like protein
MFAKQLAVAFENSFLLQRIEDLETKDAASGLYNRRYMVLRLEEEILRAISHQQPCAFVVFAFKSFSELAGTPRRSMSEDLLRQMAAVLRENMGELDRAGRIDAHEIGVILPGRNKKEAQELTLLMKGKLAGILAGQRPAQAWVVSAAVVENPVDGAEANALIEKAQESVRKQAIAFR